jgi:hypothetical protein
MKTSAAVLGIFLLSASAFAQDKGAPSQKAIDDAVRRGVEYLKTAPSPGGHLKTNCDELILLTLIHAGVPEKNETFKKYLDATLAAQLHHTYKVALHAMCLEELDPAQYQARIAQCGQFLIDNQATNGQWSYGQPTDAVAKMPVPSPRKDVASENKPQKPGVINFGDDRPKNRPANWIVITQSKTTGEQGDNSNTQYASLGLRACHDSKIKIPEGVVGLALKWWMESQHDPEDGAGDKNAVSSGGEARPRGWSYTSPQRDPDRKAYHAMSAGALGAVCIYDYILGRDYKKDMTARSGAAWLGKHFSVNTNYYYMYGLERAGMLYGVESFGGRNWYFEGAKLLLENQNGDGSWGKREDKAENTWDTCFAILFLKKATRAIATGGGRSK